MKVKIGPYKDHWISPYTIIEKIFFYKKYTDPSFDVHKKEYKKYVHFLEPLCERYNSIMNFLFPRKISIKIHNYDTWNADETLSLIILPVLQELKKNKEGIFFVYKEDVPEELFNSIDHSLCDKTFCCLDIGGGHHRECADYVLDEMIFAFENIMSSKCEIVEKRINNGLFLFAKYYRSLWT